MSKLPPPESYSTEEIQQILYLAITKSTETKELSRKHLWEIAAELDIDTQIVLQAEQDWLNQKIVSKKKQEFNLYRQGKLKNQGVRYLIINGFIFSINLISAGAFTWVFYLSLAWGLALSLETWKTTQTEGDEYERDFQHWKLKNEVKQSLTTLWGKIRVFLQEI